MRIYISDEIEGYPLYSICNQIEGFENESFEIDEATLERWQKTTDEFVKFQLELAALIRQRKGGNYDLDCWTPMEIAEDEDESWE